MVKIKAITYGQARTDFLKAEMEKAQNRMKFWQTKIKKAKNAIAEMEAHNNASNAGWEFNFYRDALEALDAQPKWISVEERLPEESGQYLIGCVGEERDHFYHIANVNYSSLHKIFNAYDWMDKKESCGYMPDYWMSVPQPPKEEV